MSNNTLLVLLPIIPILGVVWYFALSGPSSTVDYKENTADDNVKKINQQNYDNADKDDAAFTNHENNQYIDPDIADAENFDTVINAERVSDRNNSFKFVNSKGGKISSKNKRSKSRNKRKKKK